MAKVSMYDVSGKVVGSLELDDNIFGVDVNESVVHAAVVAYLANQRQGTKAAKTRSEVRGGGAKPRPQKGTGRSRQGSIRSPQWRGGGVVFAPKPRDFTIRINKKEKRIALKSVLTSKVNTSNIIVLDKLDFAGPKTKDMIKVLDNLKAEKALVVLPKPDENVVLSARNIPGIKTASVNTINVYDILKYEKFIVTKEAVDKIQEVYV